MLSFRLFDLEADPPCRYDYLVVYNGHSHTVQKLGRFCGTFRPGALLSTSNTMMLEMVSDASSGGRGFVAYFSGGKPHVDGEESALSLVSASLDPLFSVSVWSMMVPLFRPLISSSLYLCSSPQRTSSVGGD